MGHEFENKRESAKKFQISKIEEPFYRSECYQVKLNYLILFSMGYF